MRIDVLMRQGLFKRPFAIIAFLLGLTFFVAQGQGDDPLYNLPGENTPVFTSGSVDLASNGRILVAANMLNDTLSIVDIIAREVLAEVPVGDDPRSVAITPDNDRALVLNRGDGSLSVVLIDDATVESTIPVGEIPGGVIAPSNDRAWVTASATGHVLEIDIITGKIVSRIAVPDMPYGLAQWGDLLFVSHLWTGDLTMIYLPLQMIVRTISTGNDTGMSPSLAIDPRNQRLYLPQTRYNADSMVSTYDSLLFPVVNAVDLGTMSNLVGSRFTLDSVDRPVNMPFAMTIDFVRGRAYIVNAGTNDLSVVALNSGDLLGHVKVGSNPRGVVLSLDTGLAYVHNMLEGSITIVDTSDYSIDDVLPISDLSVPVDVLIGAELFHTAEDTRVSGRWASCASCHFDGMPDGRTWQSFPDGGRNTPVLYDLDATGPYTWTGDWDELADSEIKIRDLQIGTGLIDDLRRPNPASGDAHASLSLDLDILTAYLASLEGPQTPPSLDEPAMIAEGERVFEEQDCASCHVMPTGVDGLSHDVGTGGTFNTPTLNWLWLSAPYFHDGRAETLFDVFVMPGDHQLIATLSTDEIDALIAYLSRLPQ